MQRAESTQNCGWSSRRHSARKPTRLALSGRGNDSGRQSGHLPRAFLDGHPPSSTSAASTPTRQSVAVSHGEVIEDGRAGTEVVCRIDRYDGCGRCGATRTVAHLPRVPRYHFTAVLAKTCKSSPAPPRLGGRPLSMQKSLSTPHATICSDTHASGSARSGNVAVPSTAKEVAHGRSRAVGPSGPRIGEDGTVDGFSQCMNGCSHLDEAGEPSAGSGRPRPRPVERPDGPDGYGRLRRGSRRREGVKDYPDCYCEKL